MNNAAINIYLQVFMWTYVFIFLGYVPKSGIAGSYGNSMLNFLRNFRLPKWLRNFAFPPAVYEGSNFSSSPQTLSIIFIINYPGEYEVVSHYTFDLHFPGSSWC